jgi:hyperosmotically inducible protein
MQTYIRPSARPFLLSALLATTVVLSACDRTTTTAQTANGTVTTTTLAPSAQASAAMHEINSSIANAASAVESSAAASQALTRAGDDIADGVITAKVKTALLADDEVKGLRIDVETHDGVVSLSGTVDKASNIERAGHIARETSGVKSVDNRLVAKA